MDYLSIKHILPFPYCETATLLKIRIRYLCLLVSGNEEPEATRQQLGLIGLFLCPLVEVIPLQSPKSLTSEERSLKIPQVDHLEAVCR